MARKIKGFTLIELLITIAIIAILLSISVPAFLKWKDKYTIEQDIRNLASFINMARNKAFTEKINLIINIGGKSACMSCKTDDTYCNTLYTGNIQCITFDKNFGSYTVYISSRGTLNRITIFPTQLLNGSFGCIKLSTFRAKVGVINGSICQIR